LRVGHDCEDRVDTSSRRRIRNRCDSTYRNYLFAPGARLAPHCSLRAEVQRDAGGPLGSRQTHQRRCSSARGRGDNRSQASPATR
jgi:hypothetical protein